VGLSEAEKATIENSIRNGEPIRATPEYTKFLKAILPDGLKIENDAGILKFSIDIPEYEIKHGNIRANHVGAITIIEN
jgi:hypothetical protein